MEAIPIIVVIIRSLSCACLSHDGLSCEHKLFVSPDLFCVSLTVLYSAITKPSHRTLSFDTPLCSEEQGASPHVTISP